MIDAILPGLGGVANVHPLFVHFPIALLSTALAVETLALVRQDAFLHRMARSLVYLGAVAAVATAVTGDMAGDQVGHNSPGHEFVHAHRDFMITATVMAVLVAGFLFMARNRVGLFPLAGVLMLAVVVAVLLLGADRGGRLVFRHGIGVSTGGAELSKHAGPGHQNGRAGGVGEESYARP